MRCIETETKEYKKIVTDAVKKEVVAFANTRGGTIYVGIADDGSIIGIDDVDSEILKLTNMIRNAIKSDVTMFVHYEPCVLEGKNIIAVDVQQGSARPYYLADKGLKPNGVYVRQGAASVPATDAAIRRMIKETDGDIFESMRSLNQELTFTWTEKEFLQRDVPFGALQMQTLGLIGSDGTFTNLGQLLSDQCAHTVKVALFQGTNQEVFRDRREFSGSLMQQLNDVYAYLDFRNATQARFDKLLRKDTRDYPEVALREALLNLLVHRDYSFSASANISIYSDRIELVSLGGLMPGVELDDIMMGLSVCRNPHLANVFYRLELIEAYGTGMQKIMGSYQNNPVLPQVVVSSHAFKIILPNVNAIENGEAATYPQATNVSDAQMAERRNGRPSELPSEEEAILAYLQQYRTISRSEAQEVLGVSAATAYRVLVRMLDRGVISRLEKGRKTRYSAAAPEDT